MCCRFSVSYAVWAELLSILEQEHIWHANRGDLPTTMPLLLFSIDLITPSPIFKISLSLLRRDRLQHLKILFSHPAFPVPSLMQRSALVLQLAPKVEGPRKSHWFMGNCIPLPPPGSQPHLAPSRQRHVRHLDGKRGYPHRAGALAQYCECWVCESSIWYAN